MESFETIAKKVEKFNADKKNPGKNLNSGKFLSGITDIFSGIVAGIALGFFLDTIFKTKFICMVICMFLGFIGAILNIYKQIKEDR